MRHIGGAELEQLLPNIHGYAPEDGGVPSPSEALLSRALPLVVLPGEHLQLRLPRPLQPPVPVGKVRRLESLLSLYPAPVLPACCLETSFSWKVICC